jgi:DNA-binding response OmpR family regulator
MRVLIIEDEDRLRQMMRMALDADHEVGEASSGEAGLELFGSGRDWDVMLLDQRLPGIDGLETLRRLKQRDADVCVVMITAFASIELAVEAMKVGAADFLRKPVAPEALRGALAAALRRKADRSAEGDRGGTTARPEIVRLTLNGFQILHEPQAGAPPRSSSYDHVFTVLQHANGEQRHVVVQVDPDEVDRVARLARRALPPQGAFWRIQAEQLLATALWLDGRVPASGRLLLTGLPPEALDLAAGWSGD